MNPGIKIILSFFAGVTYWRSFTPPTPPASSKEQIKVDGLFGRTIRKTSVLGKTTIASAIFFQISSLLALYYPSYLPKSGISSPDYILSHICPAINAATTSKLSFAPNIATLSPEFLLGVLLMISMGLLRLWCFRTLARHFTFEISIQESHKLIRTGPYAIVRHPAYIGQILVIFGSFLMSFSRGSWINECGILKTSLGFWLTSIYVTLSSIGAFSLGRRGALEDVELKKVFGKEWISYSQDVPYRLIPGVY